MHIKKILLKGYKRFRDLTIDLGDSPKRVIALVGPNGCGKSSVFDAMLFLTQSYSGNLGGAQQSRDFRYHSLEQIPNYDYKNVEIVFQDGNFKQVFQNMKTIGRERSIFSFRSSFRYNGNLQVKGTKAVTEIRLNQYGASSASDIDQRIEEGYRRLLAKYNHYLEKENVRPSEAKEHIIGELNNALQKCLDIEIQSLGNVESDRGTLYFKKNDSDIVFDYNVLSAGEKEVVDLLLDLYIRKDTYTDSIYIIDEPELHLNTAIQRSLLTEINEMIPPNCQIWIATHSIGFLRALQEELREQSQVIEFKAENKWASESYVLEPINTNRTMWQSIFSTALDDLTRLICPQTIIYCEGRAEPGAGGRERGLDANVFNGVFAKKHPGFLFVSSGGNTEPDQRSNIALAILSKVFPDLNIWVLKDRDIASGKVTNEHTRQLYLQNNPANHRVLKRFEIENYLYDKEVLKGYCQKNSLPFDVVLYDSIVTEIYNQNLKDKTGDIKKCCSITVSIDPEKFKMNLAECILDSMNVYKELEEEIFERK